MSPAESDTESSEEEAPLSPVEEEDGGGSGSEVITREVILRPKTSTVSVALSKMQQIVSFCFNLVLF